MSIMKKISEFLYRTEQVELTFDVPIEEAIKRLDANVGNSVFSHLTSEGMVGSVSRDTVKIHRVIPMMKNSFKPMLIGSFSTLGGRTILSGVFRMHRLVQVFMTFWFGVLAFSVLTEGASILVNPSDAWPAPLVGFMMIAFGVGLVKIGKWLSRNDKEWLKERVSASINQT